MNIFPNNEEASGSLAPQHELELLFNAAISDPVLQARFYQRLLKDVVFVIIDYNPLWESGEHVIEEEEDVAIYAFEDGVIPVFTSEERIYDNKALPATLQYIRIYGDQILNIAHEVGIIINPFSKQNVTFPGAHVAKILDGTIFGKREDVKSSEGGKATMKVPASFPEKAFEALKRLYKTLPEVQEAYVVEVAYDDDENQPFLMIAIKTQGDFNAISAASSYVFNENAKHIETIQFYHMAGTDDYDRYFTAITKPFYRKYAGITLN